MSRQRSNVAGYDITEQPIAPNLLLNFDGETGLYTPSISPISGGYRLSWTNNLGLENPDPVDILNGAPGEPGADGETGETGATFTPSVAQTLDEWIISWSNDKGLENPEPVHIYNGAKGDTGAAGAVFTPVLTATIGGHTLSWSNNGGLPNPAPVTIADGSDAESSEVQWDENGQTVGGKLTNVSLSGTTLTFTADDDGTTRTKSVDLGGVSIRYITQPSQVTPTNATDMLVNPEDPTVTVISLTDGNSTLDFHLSNSVRVNDNIDHPNDDGGLAYITINAGTISYGYYVAAINDYVVKTFSTIPVPPVSPGRVREAVISLDQNDHPEWREPIMAGLKGSGEASYTYQPLDQIRVDNSNSSSSVIRVYSDYNHHQQGESTKVEIFWGLTKGGSTGQALKKTSNANGAAEWADVHEVPTPVSSGLVLKSNGNTPGAYEWGSAPSGASPTGSGVDVDNSTTLTGDIDSLTFTKEGFKRSMSMDVGLPSNYTDEFGTVPSGGSSGNVLIKKSNSDYDTEWKSLPIVYKTAVGSIPFTGTDSLGAKISTNQIPYQGELINISQVEWISAILTNGINDARVFIPFDVDVTDPTGITSSLLMVWPGALAASGQNESYTATSTLVQTGTTWSGAVIVDVKLQGIVRAQIILSFNDKEPDANNIIHADSFSVSLSDRIKTGDGTLLTTLHLDTWNYELYVPRASIITEWNFDEVT